MLDTALKDARAGVAATVEAALGDVALPVADAMRYAVVDPRRYALHGRRRAAPWPANGACEMG